MARGMNYGKQNRRIDVWRSSRLLTQAELGQAAESGAAALIAGMGKQRPPEPVKRIDPNSLEGRQIALQALRRHKAR